MVTNVRISINVIPFGSFQSQETLSSPEQLPPPAEEEGVIPLSTPSLTAQGTIVPIVPDFVSPVASLLG